MSKKNKKNKGTKTISSQPHQEKVLKEPSLKPLTELSKAKEEAPSQPISQQEPPSEPTVSIYRTVAKEGNKGSVVFETLPRSIVNEVPLSAIDGVIHEAARRLGGMEEGESLVAMMVLKTVRTVPSVEIVEGLPDA